MTPEQDTADAALITDLHAVLQAVPPAGRGRLLDRVRLYFCGTANVPAIQHPSAQKFGLEPLLRHAGAEEARAIRQAWAADWARTRDLILLAIASFDPSRQATDGKGDWIAERVIARAAELNLTAYAIAKRTEGAVTENAVKDFLSRRCSLSSRKLQHLFKVLGLTVVVDPRA